MTNSFKECISILMVFLCLVFPAFSQATEVAIKDLFKEDKKHIAKGDFVEDAVYFSLNQEVLTKLKQANHKEFTLAIPFENGKELSLQLKQTSFLSTDFKVKVQKDNINSTLLYSPGLYYRGSIHGIKDAFVAFNIFDEAVTGVLTVNGQNYNIGRYEKGTDNTFVLYRESQLNIPNPFKCSTEDLDHIRVERPSASSRSNGDNLVRVYIECDHHLYKNKGSDATKVMDFTTGLLNVVTALYQQEDITIEISEVKVWSTPDPYLTSSAKNARNDFGAKLNGNFNGDVAHLLSNYLKNGAPPNGGSANIDVLCDKQKAVSYTNVTTSYLSFPTFSWTAYAVTHEIGHNLGSPHTHSCLWATGPIDNCWCPEGGCGIGPEPASSGTMMSYCHLDPKWTNSCDLSSSNPGINFAAGFGRQPGDLIRLRVKNASCLSGFGGTTTSGPLSINFETQDESCSGRRDAYISVTVENGEAPYSYRWNTGATSSSITNVSGGNYAVTVTDKFGKQANGTARINAGVAIQINAGPDKELGCSDREVLLDARNSVSGFQYTDVWSKVGGNISGSVVGSIYGSTLTVTKPGTYIYTITNTTTGCTSSDAVVVQENTEVSTVQIASTSITCNQPYAQLSAQNAPQNGVYQWIGPNGFSSVATTPQVDVPGIYRLTIQTGSCTRTGQVEVRSASDSKPQVTALGGTLDCASTFVSLNGRSNESVTYAWTGPNNFTSSQQNPTTSLPGMYTLVVTNNNGCTNTSTAQVGLYNNPPGVSVQGGQLSCASTSIMLQVISNENNINYNWTGPNGFTSTSKNPIVRQEGNYVLTATGENGCSIRQIATVVGSTETPSLSINAAPLNCTNVTTYLEVASNVTINEYNWSGPNNFISNASRPQVSQAGVYTLQAVGTNGCSSSLSYSLVANSNLPDFSLSAAAITCNRPTTFLQVSLNSLDYEYRWTGPNGFLSFESTPSVNIAGTYSLMVLGANGCSTVKSITVDAGLSQPTVEVSSSEMSCDGGNAQLFAQSSASTDQFFWSGPNFYSTEQNPMVTTVGNYELLVKSTNGCTVTKTVEVKAATIQVANIIKRNDHCGNRDGSISIEMQQPDETYDVRWNTGHTGLNLLYLPAGIYSGTISNTSGCTTTISVAIEAGEDLRLLTVDRTKISCYNDQDGAIGVRATGGEAPYQYLWSNGTTEAINTNLSAGTHSVEIEDARGCVRTFHFDLENPEPLEVMTEIGEGEAAFFAEGGSPEYKYDWSNGLTSDSAYDLDQGDYEVTISDANGCAVVEKFTLESFEIVESIENPVPENSGMISPNPADTYFNLSYEFEEEELIFISVFNAQGFYLYRKTVETTILREWIPTSTWKEGTYYVQLLTKNGFVTEELKVIHR